MSKGQTMTVTEFLLARITEDENAAKAVPPLSHNYDVGGNKQEEHFTFGRELPNGIDGMGNSSKHRYSPTTEAHFSQWTPQRVLAESAAKRAIVQLHDQWPVLIQTEPSIEHVHTPLDPYNIVLRASQQIDWITNRAYVERFGTEPPTTPILEALATVYQTHPDYNPEWSTK